MDGKVCVVFVSRKTGSSIFFARSINRNKLNDSSARSLRKPVISKESEVAYRTYGHTDMTYVRTNGQCYKHYIITRYRTHIVKRNGEFFVRKKTMDFEILGEQHSHRYCSCLLALFVVT